MVKEQEISVQFKLRADKFLGELDKMKRKLGSVSTALTVSGSAQAQYVEGIGKLEGKYTRLEKSIADLIKREQKLAKSFTAAKLKAYNKQVGILENQFKKTETQLKKTTLAAGGFSAEMLGIMFFGMAMQQLFTGALKSIFEGYKKILPEAHEFVQLTNRLNGEWSFFKFQLADALASSSLFQTLTEALFKVLDVFQNLSPAQKEFIGWMLILGAVVGAFLFIIGQLGLGIFALMSVFTKLRNVKGFKMIFDDASRVWNMFGKIKNAMSGWAWLASHRLRRLSKCTCDQPGNFRGWTKRNGMKYCMLQNLPWHRLPVRMAGSRQNWMRIFL